MGCMIWTGATAKDYGVMRWRNNRMTQATIIAWEIAYGVLPENQMQHTCDVRRCVNVAHLYDGVQTQNVVDMHSRNPANQAENAHARKLAYTEVDTMRRLYRTGEWSFQRLAAHFQVSYSVTRDAVTGRSYPRGPIEPPVPAMGHGRPQREARSF